MNDESNRTHRVAVRRWRSDYLVPVEHPAPEAVRLRLDSVVRSDMPGSLGTQLRRVLDPTDSGLVWIRRLAFEVAVNAACSPEDIAAQCARALAVSLSRELAEGDGANVVRFASPTEHLAHFLVDTAIGVSAGCWYYAEFAGLAGLPASAAIRTALLANWPAGIAALRMLDDGDLVRVVATLGPRESDRVCEAAERVTASGDPVSLLEECAEVWCQHPPPVNWEAAPELALWLIARSATSPDRASVAIARAWAALAVALARGQMTLAGLDTMLDERGPAPQALSREAIELLRACPRALLRTFRGKEGLSSAAPLPGVEWLGSTPFGGTFFVLDDLFALELERHTAGWPEVLSTSPARALGLLVLGCVCAGEKASGLFADPLLRRLFTIHPGLTFEAAMAWLEMLGSARARGLERMMRQRLRVSSVAATSDAARLPALSAADRRVLMLPPPMSREWSRCIGFAAQRVLWSFAQRIPGYARSHAEYLQRNFLAATARVEAETSRVVVRLSRPPLAVMLNLVGLNRGARKWPALDDRPFALFTED